MALTQLTDPHAVWSAIEEFDELGRERFLDKHGFGPARRYFLMHEGRAYDSKAIAGVAFGHQHPERGTLGPEEFSGGEETVGRVLRSLGFTVEVASAEPGTDTHRSVSRFLDEILKRYVPARKEGKGGPFGGAHPLWVQFEGLADALRGLEPIRSRPGLQVKWSAGQGNWARVPWVALMEEDETTSTQRGVYAVFLFREDMSGVYLTWNQGVTELRNQHGTREGRRILRERATRLEDFLPTDRRGFETGDGIDLRTDAGLARAYENSTIAFRLYEPDALPEDREVAADLEVVLTAYDRYLGSDLQREFTLDSEEEEPNAEILTGDSKPTLGSAFDRPAALESLLKHIAEEGWVYEPWQVAQYVTAVRTKPFVILAGITGTGKSKLPSLVAKATGGKARLVPVRPDWTDSSEVLGYLDLEGVFRPGSALEVASTAVTEDDVHHTLIVDEMNLARVEHYFAEVLSRIEDRHAARGGGFESSHLIRMDLREEDAEWGRVRLPANLALVGTVNMDESAHGFSRKVLDRAFTLELSEVDLEAGLNPRQDGELALPPPWPVDAWFPRAIRLSQLNSRSGADAERIVTAVTALQEVNALLTPAQLQVGYRTRDEVALFLVHAAEIEGAFRTSEGHPVSPLDLALQMKILPRIAGGSGAVRHALLGLLGWAWMGRPFNDEMEARELMDEWHSDGRPSRMTSARYPGFASRCALMLDRLQTEGFTSYWL